MKDSIGTGVFPPLTGYVDHFSAKPGERIDFKISSTESFTADLVKIICGDPNPDGPGMKLEPVVQESDSCFGGRSYPANVQNTQLGSYGITDHVDHLRLPTDTEALVLEADIWPTLADCEKDQTIFAFHGQTFNFVMRRSNGGCLAVEFSQRGNKSAESSVFAFGLDEPLMDRVWYKVRASISSSGTMTLSQRTWKQTFDVLHLQEKSVTNRSILCPKEEVSGIFTVAAELLSRSPENTKRATNNFNGKISDPCLLVRTVVAESDRVHQGDDGLDDDLMPQLSLLAHFDFSDSISSQMVQGHHGERKIPLKLVNMPTRGMKGPDWDGTEMCWRHAPSHYNAIHFHDDDLYDCEWVTTFSFLVPSNMKSGVYGAQLQQRISDTPKDIIPFYILPSSRTQRAKVLFLASTFTYQIYANHVRYNSDNDEYQRRLREWSGACSMHPDDYHPIYGASTYNRHSDGSGICYSSRLRPILTMRPGFITFGEERAASGLRHFPADTHILDWLYHLSTDFDVITDEDLHYQGVSALTPYRVVLTGSHPEYQTVETMNALQEYTDERGGRLLYLGGNGFYWKIAIGALDTGAAAALEIRRGEGGIRAWSSEPGEYYNNLDGGGYGGLWRRNGRPPQLLGGVGFSSQGMFLGSYYRRRQFENDNIRDKVAWAFEDVSADEGGVVGDFGLSGGGAAGFELDRADVRLGTPRNAIVLASSENHGDTFIPVYEELLTHYSTETGDPKERLVRADMVLCPKANGGCIFSTGSITYCGSLSHDDYNNDIAKLTTNVLRRFLESETAVV